MKLLLIPFTAAITISSVLLLSPNLVKPTLSLLNPQVLSSQSVVSSSPKISPTNTATSLPSSTPEPTPVEPTLSPTQTPSPKPALIPTTTPKIISTPTIKLSVSPTTSFKDTSTTTPTLSPLPKQTSTPIPTPNIGVATSEQINNYINEYSSQYKVDPNVLRHIALCESGFNPQAKHLSYLGLFQYSSSTWSSYRNRMGENPDPVLRADAQAAVKTTAYALSLGRTGLWPNCYPK